MKHVAPVLLALLLAIPLGAGAEERDDYAQQWPLTLSRDDGGAYRVVLDEAVYRQLQSRDLRDLNVLNRDGATVPAALFGPEQPLAKGARRVAVPWFPLPSPQAAAANAQQWHLVSEADADGRLRRVEATIGATGTSLPRTALLIDLSRVREAVAALELHWKPVEALDLGYRVEASDDLQNWQPLATRGRLIDLQREGQHLLHRRIELFGLLPHYQKARYLRLTAERDDQPVEITAINVELPVPPATPAPHWLGILGTHPGDAKGDVFEFIVNGRFPVQQVDVALPGNHAIEWRLESRDDDDAAWQVRAGPWVAYQVDAGGQGTQSAPRVLNNVVRDRYWRLRANGPVSGQPTLRLGYRPEVMVFLAQGPAPYSLVAGSSRARRADAPLPHLVEGVRKQRGADWQPSPAYLGKPQALAGEVATVPARDWRSQILWGVLVLGALIVAGFAFTLLRVARPAQRASDASDPEGEKTAERDGDETASA